MGCVMMVMMVKSLSNMRQGRQRADTRLPFGVMCAGKMGFALETGRLFKRRVPAVRQSFEQAPGCAIIFGYGGRQIGDAALLWSRQQRFDHAPAKTLTPHGG